jgi:hypothetical protein
MKRESKTQAPDVRNPNANGTNKRQPFTFICSNTTGQTNQLSAKYGTTVQIAQNGCQNTKMKTTGTAPAWPMENQTAR